MAAIGIAAGLVLGQGGGGGGTHPGAPSRPSERTTTRVAEEGTHVGSPGISVSRGQGSAGLPSNPSATAGTAARLAAQPCRLVSRPEAEAILGTRIAAPRQASLGPSCVYIDGAETISISVESFSYGSISSRLQAVKEFAVAGRSVYCATLGRPLLLAPINPNSTLEVTAACPVALAFAAAAIPRLADA